MRHTQEGNPFQSKDPYPGASASVRRALSQMNFQCPAVQRTAAACRALKLNPSVPVYKGDAFAHIGIPSKKVAIYFSSSGNRGPIEIQREAWKKIGWEALSVVNSAIERTPDSALQEHLKSAIDELGKSK